MFYKKFSAILDVHKREPLPIPEFNTFFNKDKYKSHEIITVNSIDDMLYLIDSDSLDSTSLSLLKNIKEPLEELSRFIGINTIKNNIIEQILYYLQDLNGDDDYLHTVICGPPGTGKTELSKIIGTIFCNLGILKKKTFKKVTRSDLIAGYLGQTAIKTKDVVKEAIGGVLFIDEVYALGNSEKSDSFSKECIDTLCEALSDHKNEIMVIVAGYEKDIEKCFFSYNQGLRSRFIWKYTIEDYTYDELFSILLQKIKKSSWNIDNAITSAWFEDKTDDFKYFGRDVEQFFSKIKICHAKRIFGKINVEKKRITFSDLEAAYKRFKKEEPEDKKDLYLKMYS